MCQYVSEGEGEALNGGDAGESEGECCGYW